MNRRKVGFLLGGLKGGGAERKTLDTADVFLHQGHEVHLFLLNHTYDYTPNERLVIHCMREGLCSRKEKQLELKQLIQDHEKDENFDLFINTKYEFANHIPVTNTYTVIHNTHSSLISDHGFMGVRRWKKYRKLKKALNDKRIIAISEGIKNDLVNTIGIKAREIKVINNPFNFSQIQDQADGSFDGIKSPYIIYVANLIDRKRHDILLEAFAQLSNRNLSLVLLGKGPHEKHIRTHAKHLNIADRVIFPGWRADAYKWIKHADLSVLTSETEGLPNTLVESCILHTPIVSTDCPSGPNEILLNEMGKYLTPCGNVEELVKAMEEALNEKPLVPLAYYQRFSHTIVSKDYLKLL